MTDKPRAGPADPDAAPAYSQRRLAGRLILAMIAGAAIGALVGTAAGIAPFAALVGAPLGMAGAVLAGE